MDLRRIQQERHEKPLGVALSRRAVHAQLARQIDGLEKRVQGFGTQGSAGRIAQKTRVKFGIDSIDQCLDPHTGAGIEVGGLHEVRSASTTHYAAASGFAFALGHFLRSRNAAALHELPTDFGEGKKPTLWQAPIFWVGDGFCRKECGDPYGPGLSQLGLEAGHIVRIFPRDLTEALWVAGEISRDQRNGFGLMEVRGNPRLLDLAATRQLCLRCRDNGAPFFILRQAGDEEASAALTRWRVCAAGHAPALCDGVRRMQGFFSQTPRWHVALEKCRGGRTGDWILEWNHHEQAFRSVGENNFGSDAHTAARQSGASKTLSGDLPAASGERPHHTQASGHVVAFERAS